MHHPSGHSQNYELCNGHEPIQAFQNKYSIELQKHELCPICAYHFSINDIPKASIFRSALPLAQDLFKELVIHLPFQQLFSNKSPRAPPVFQ